MELSQFFKSVIEQDTSAVVICGLNHIILYMNKAASEKYANRGGKKLEGKSLLECHNEESCKKLKKFWTGLSKAIEITLSVPFTTKKKTRTFIWWRFGATTESL